MRFGSDSPLLQTLPLHPTWPWQAVSLGALCLPLCRIGWPHPWSPSELVLLDMNPASPTYFAWVLTPPPYSCLSRTSPGPEISPVSPGQPLCFCSSHHACNYSLRAHLAWEVWIPAPGTVSYCSCLYTISGVPSHDSRQDPGPGMDPGPLYSPTHLYGTGAVGGGEMVRREGPVKSVSSVIVCQMG